ncbi:hypothetical protein N658DRAFT_400448, partial [Parathielavia hyrcaniae]
KREETGSCSYHSGRAGRVPEVLISPAAASPKRPRLNLLIPKLPSSSVSRTPLRSPSPPYIAGTGNNVATAHATSGGSRLPQPLRAGRLHCGDVGGTKMPPKDVIVISSDDESSDTTDAASIVEHKTARLDHGCQRNPRLFAKLCETTSNDDDSKCLSHDERDKRRFRHHEETRQKSNGRYRSASHDHHGDGDQTSGSARHHPPVPDETGEPTKNDSVRLLHVQERRASPSVVPDHQSISEPKLADAE